MDQPQKPETGEERIREERQRDSERDEELRDARGHREHCVGQAWNRHNRGEPAEEVQDGVREAVRSQCRKARTDPKRQNGASDDQHDYEAVRTHRLVSVTQVNTTPFLGRCEATLEAAAALMV